MIRWADLRSHREFGAEPADVSWAGRLLHRILGDRRRATLILLYDTIASALAVILAVYLQLQSISSTTTLRVLSTAIMISWISAFFYLVFDIHRRSWRYVSLGDLFAITKCVSIVAVALTLILKYPVPISEIPITVPIIYWFVVLALLFAPRIAVRLYVGGPAAETAGGGDRAAPVLVIGMDRSAENFIRANAASNRARKYRPVGILAKSRADVGRTVHGIPILGTIADLGAVVELLEHQGLRLEWLALSSSRREIDGTTYRSICDTARLKDLLVARLPQLAKLQESSGPAAELQPLAIEELLGRPQVSLDRQAIFDLIAGRRVLVTGGGGTIGGELVRQIGALQPAELVMIDHSEFNLYRVDMEMREAGLAHFTVPLICDVRDAERVGQIVADHRPEIIFHAAALKHVPVVEANPSEGVLTNVLGTCNIADAAIACGAKIMVLVSTDKAVDPTSVMGMTKRIAECYCQSLDLAPRPGSDTRLITVRFGNVLGSSGSVIPLFQRQISCGGPVTVTHPDVRRFFMTLHEAVGLILQAASYGVDRPRASGQVFVLDMGAPIRIADVAEKMIRLAGLEPHRDIRIEYVGLRPGEKLTENLFREAELVSTPETPSMLVAQSKHVALPVLRSMLDELIRAAQRRDEQALLRSLKQVVRFCDGRGPAVVVSCERRPRDLPKPTVIGAQTG